ncbi:MAG: pre-toxin TG domain-containing protein [Oligoflexales bacterium]
MIARDFHFDQQWDLASTVMDYAQDALDFAIQPENQFQYDLITGMTPGISWGRDVFEAIFGIDLITGAELSSVERSMAILGVVTAGTGNKVGRIAKIINKADDYMDRSENIENATDAVRHTERVLDSAKKHGISDNRIAPLIGDMKNWGRTKGNFDISDGTSKEAKFLGESWVGPDARQIDYGGKPGKFQYISQDGTKKYREPVVKDGSGIKQANFEWKDPATGKWIGNGHMDITD